MEFFSSVPGLLILAIFPSVIVSIIGYLYWQRLDKSWNQRQVSQVLESIGVEYLKDIMLPDGIEGYTYIDYLLLTPKGLVVLDINLSEGHIFGAETVNEWTQVVKNKTYKFNNPLYDNQTKCQAVKWNVKNILKSTSSTDDIETYGWIAFSSAGNFPKGIPENISMIKDLNDDLNKKFKLHTGNNESSRNTLEQLFILSMDTKAEAGN